METRNGGVHQTKRAFVDEPAVLLREERFPRARPDLENPERGVDDFPPYTRLVRHQLRETKVCGVRFEDGGPLQSVQ